jgi:hypothetical protein
MGGITLLGHHVSARLATLVALVIVAVVVLRGCPGSDAETERLEGVRDSVTAIADSLARVVASNDVERDSLLAELETAEGIVEVRIREVQVQRAATASVRDSNMTSLIEAISADAPHLTEGALAVAAQVQATDSLYRQEITDLNKTLVIVRTRAERWETDFWLEREEKTAIRAALAAEVALRERLESRLRAANRLDLGIIRVPEWVGYVGAGIVGLEVGRRLNR